MTAADVKNIMSSINTIGAATQSQASLFALRKTLDAQTQQGAALTDLIKQAGPATLRSDSESQEAQSAGRSVPERFEGEPGQTLDVTA